MSPNPLRLVHTFVLILVLVLPTASHAHGAGAGASVSGTVTDPLGSAVSGAKVTVFGPSHAGATATTSADGRYVLDGLPEGAYTLKAELAGFTPFVRTGLSVEAGRARTVDVRLELPGLAREVTVESEPGNFLIEEKEIELLKPLDKAGLLSHESMVAVGGGSPVAQKIYVRGFEDTLLNVTVDGAAQAGELYHHQGRVQIEPEFLKAIELEAGAGPATSGAGALTGALRLTSKDAFDHLEPGRSFGALVKATGELNGDDALGGVVSLYGKLSPNLGLVVSGVARSGDDYADGNGDLVTPTAYDQKRGNAKLSGLFDEHRFDLSYEHLADEGTYYERPNLTNFTGTYVLSDHEMTRDTVSYNHRWDPAGDALELAGTAYWTSSDFHNARNTTGVLYGAGEFASLGLDLRNTARLGRHVLVGGVEVRRDDASGTQQATPPRFWGSSDQEASVLGLYVQDQWQLHPMLALSAGLRFDAYRHEVVSGVGAGAKNDDSGLSPNASVSFTPAPWLTLRGSYAQAFRGITIREAFFSGLYVHRGDLEPERADNLEVGLDVRHGPWFVRGTLFRQNIHDYINAVYDGGTAWGYWENVGDAEVEGYEVEVGARWGLLSVAAGVWDCENTINGRPMTDADLGLGTSLGRTWNVRADWSAPGPRLDLGLRVRIVEDEPNAISPTALDKEGYVVTDLHASWEPLEGIGLTVGASVTNFFDEYYYDQATYTVNAAGVKLGFPSKGRAFVLSTSYRF